MRVLHLNVRLSEGGAARVALDLHARLLRREIRSKLFYGYGPGARKSPYEAAVPHAYQLGRRAQVIGNYFMHGLTGVDVFPPLGRGAEFDSALRETDVVHLHVIHSHFAPYAWLLERIGRLNKKVVWTLHDSWAFTGRCAITADCERWGHGCGNCPLKANYPSAMLDLSASESIRKRKKISSLKEDLVLVGCSRWTTRRARLVFPDHEVRLVHNGLDAEMEGCLRSAPAPDEARSGAPNLLLVGADLSDPQKQDIGLLRRVIGSGECTVHTVGKHSPFGGKNVVNHGPVFDRTRLVELYRGADATLFTSRVDSFGLVIAESLAAGTPVLALDSPGSREVLGLMEAKPVEDGDEVLNRVRRRSFFDLYEQQSRRELRDKALEVFSGEGMAERYVNIYESALSRAGA